MKSRHVAKRRSNVFGEAEQAVVAWDQVAWHSKMHRIDRTGRTAESNHPISIHAPRQQQRIQTTFALAPGPYMPYSFRCLMLQLQHFW